VSDNNGPFRLAMFKFFIFFAYVRDLLDALHDCRADPRYVDLPHRRGGGMTQRATPSQQQMQRAQVHYAQAGVPTQSGASASDQIASAKGLPDSAAISQPESDQLKAKALAW